MAKLTGLQNNQKKRQKGKNNKGKKRVFKIRKMLVR